MSCGAIPVLRPAEAAQSEQFPPSAWIKPHVFPSQLKCLCSSSLSFPSALASAHHPSLLPLPFAPLLQPLLPAQCWTGFVRVGRGAGSIPMSGLRWERHCGGRRRWRVLALPISSFFQCTGGRAAAEPDRILGLGCCVRRLFVVHVLLICIFMIKPAAVRCWEDLG